MKDPEECKIIPRVRQSNNQNRLKERKEKLQAVVLSESRLRSYFHLPLSDAAEKLGVCSTALKK
jgi:hypothetical protein